MELKWIGLSKNKELLGASKRIIQLTKNDIIIKITITRIVCEETIIIRGEMDENYAINVLFSMLRLDNLFDGYFISPRQIIIDGKNCPRYLRNWLPFYRSKRKLDCLTYNNDDWDELFERWLELDEKLGIIHNMFLYASYSEDLTPDVKTALILQTFEPLADDLIEMGYISLIEKTEQFKCKECGNVTEKKKSITLTQKLECIMDLYGRDIFVRENYVNLAKRSKNTRNKIVHLERQKKDTLSGQQTGCYYYKFNLLYRNVILNLLGVTEDSINKQIRNNSLKWKDEMLLV